MPCPITNDVLGEIAHPLTADDTSLFDFAAATT